MVRSLLNKGEVPKELWPEAVVWFVYILNRNCKDSDFLFFLSIVDFIFAAKMKRYYAAFIVAGKCAISDKEVTTLMEKS